MSVDRFVMKGKRPVIEKDPNAVLDYTVDFSFMLGSSQDRILTATVLSTGGLVVDSVTFTDNTVTAWLSGGNIRTPEEDYASATYRITTVNSPARIDDRTVWFDVKQR